MNAIFGPTTTKACLKECFALTGVPANHSWPQEMGVFVADYLKLVVILTADSLNIRRLWMIESAAGTDYQELSRTGRLHPQDMGEKMECWYTMAIIFGDNLLSEWSLRHLICCFVLSRLWNLPRPHLGAPKKSRDNSCWWSTKTVLNKPLSRMNKLMKIQPLTLTNHVEVLFKVFKASLQILQKKILLTFWLSEDNNSPVAAFCEV